MPKKLFMEKTITHLTKENFNIVSSDEIYINDNAGKFGLLLVYKETCPYCIAIKKMVRDTAKEFSHMNLSFYVADQTAEKYLYMVKTVPAFYLISENNKLHRIEPEKRTVYELLVAYILCLTDIMKNDVSMKKDIPNSLYNDVEGVTQLTVGDFIKTDSGIMLRNHNKPGLLKAYANWCIFCKMKTEMIKKLSDDTPNINIYVIDLADDRDNPLNEIVAGYPTFLLVDSDNYVHGINDKDTTEALLEKEEAKSGGITEEEKKDLIFAINTVMN